MKQGEYWKKRFKKMEEAQNDTSLEKNMEIQELFDRSLYELDKKIRVWYQRLADNNGVSMVEAKKLLSNKELKEFRWSLEEYIQHAKDNELGQFEKELENASARVHIGRLEALKVQVQAEMERMFGNYTDSIDQHILDLYNNEYYHTAFEIQKGIGIGSQLQALDTAKVEKIIHNPWAVDEQNFSDRIWKDKKRLINTVHQSLTKMCITGDSPDTAIKEIQTTMNTTKRNASRLVMTESAVFANKARKECMENLGVQEFEVIETLDGITCPKCGSMDGKHFPMSEYVVGVTAPPFHPNCRGCTSPYFDDEFTVGEERVARNEEGKTYNVPANMTYEEWKQSFVEDGRKKVVENTGKSDIIIPTNLQLFANIPEEKFTKYALDPEKAPDKAKAFQSALGYNKTNYAKLIENINNNIDESKFVEKGDKGHGMLYEYVMELTGENGKKANVLTAWIDDGGEKRLTSVYVTKKKVTK